MHTTTPRLHSLAPERQDDWLLPPPNPADRLPCHVDPRDLRRLELNAILTTAGIAPSPGDREAIDRISALPDGVHTALCRWLTAGRDVGSVSEPVTTLTWRHAG
ncbi:hypothetical protein [Streptomyces longispororuber]|uniref:hypothetical protein n=1 Tax=Streptomyces longispororuber TaxID=68230 RepID=UPI002109AC68|nr:hypothetical protein [Streptomyces longispororuber]MCQ4213103.1 hypothetical protein [Streptomyces longispororuber]